jgi:hypothetical protein
MYRIKCKICDQGTTREDTVQLVSSRFDIYVCLPCYTELLAVFEDELEEFNYFDCKDEV